MRGVARAVPAGPVVHVTGAAVSLAGDDVDTDRIMPARFLRVVTFDGLGDHVFEDDRRACAARGEVHPFDDPRTQEASILVVNRNFGCGSSREHAPQGLLRRGIRAIVGQSFAEIFFGNAATLGIPCLTAPAADLTALMAAVTREPGRTVEVDLREMFARADALSVPLAMPDAVRQAFLDGSWDATGLLLEGFADVLAVAAQLPYLRNFA